MKKFFILILCLSFFSFNNGAFAFYNSIDDLFVVKDIPVSYKSFSSSEAKKQALALARVEAFNKVLKRLLNSYELQSVIIPDDYNMEKFVQSFRLDNERTTSSSYSALVDVVINKNLMLDYLKNQDLQMLEDLPPRTLIIYKNFDISDFNKVILDSVVPFVDVISQNSLGFDLDNMNEALFKSLLSLYKANNIIIINVTQTQDGLCDVEFEDKIFSIKDSFTSSCDKNELYNLLNIRIKDAYINVQDMGDFSNSVSLLIPISGIMDWLDMEKIISKISAIKSFEVQALKYNKAQLKLFYNYDLNSVINSLKEAGLDIQNKNGYLIVKR